MGTAKAASTWTGPDGKRIRRKVSGKTKQELRDKLKALHQELSAEVRSSRTHTVREAVEDCLREGLDGTSERTRTLYRACYGPALYVARAASSNVDRTSYKAHPQHRHPDPARTLTPSP